MIALMRKNKLAASASKSLAESSSRRLIRSTTVLCVRRDNKVVMAGDGQVTLGESVIKHGAKKIRRLYQDKILAGFAGSTADAFTLFSRFEAKLEQYHGNIGRAAVELAKDWRTDKFLRHLEALLLVTDKETTFLLSGQGDVIEKLFHQWLHRNPTSETPRYPHRRSTARIRESGPGFGFRGSVVGIEPDLGNCPFQVLQAQVVRAGIDQPFGDHGIQRQGSHI